MKVYISGDIEGITGVTHWNETEKNLPDWIPFSKQMTDEINAAVLGSLDAGATEIIVKDAHDSGRNIDIFTLHESVRLIRGWVGDPLSMVTTLDKSFDAVIFVGYHSPAGSIGNPLSHTMNGHNLNYIKINNSYASEFTLHAYAAALYDVPVVFVSGDKELTEIVNITNSNINTLPVKEGRGSATISIHPSVATTKTRKLVYDALIGDINLCKIPLPNEFDVEICYKEHSLAYRMSFYPNAKYLAPNIVKYKTKDIYDVLRLINFLT